MDVAFCDSLMLNSYRVPFCGAWVSCAVRPAETA